MGEKVAGWSTKVSPLGEKVAGWSTKVSPLEELEQIKMQRGDDYSYGTTIKIATTIART